MAFIYRLTSARFSVSPDGSNERGQLGGWLEKSDFTSDPTPHYYLLYTSAMSFFDAVAYCEYEGFKATGRWGVGKLVSIESQEENDYVAGTR